MTTWTSRGSFLLLVCLALTACIDGQSGTGGDRPLSQVRMMSGDVMLVAPPGYCIDKASLKPAFALMARCDTLGAANADADVPLGLITTSLVAAVPDQPLPTAAEIEAIRHVDSVLRRNNGKDRILLQLTGDAPAPNLSATHWRGAARIGSYIAAVAVYGPEGGAAAGGDGQRLLTRLIDRSRARSGDLAKALAAEARTAEVKKTP